MSRCTQSNIGQRNYLSGQWRKRIAMLRRVIALLFLLTCALECCMYFVLDATDALEDSTNEYIYMYVIRPQLFNLGIILAGWLVCCRVSNPMVNEVSHLVVITFMIGNIANVHNIFHVLLFLFMVPIFMTVVFQNRQILNLITLLTEGLILCIVFKAGVSDSSAYRDRYFLPSVILVMVLLLACRYLAGVLIRILDERTNELLGAMEEAEEAKRRAEESNRSKSEFLSNVSHEIRTPINAVLGMDEMIIRESNQPEIVDYARNIQSAGKALLGLVNDILDLSKIESGKMELIPADYEISSTINDLLNMISSRACDKGLTFTVEVDPKLPYLLYGDEIRIKQVVINLLTNAVKYTEKGSVVMQVGFSRQEENTIALSFVVKDTGKGMKKEDMDKLFSPYERIEEERNRYIEGTGLGMSITRKLLSLMNSELQVESVYGEGSTFSFEVIQEVRSWEELGDYSSSYKTSHKDSQKYKERFTTKDVRILVVDDVAVNLKVFTGLLKKTRMEIDTALSGEEGLALAKDKKYDIIFIDHMMPRMDGIEMLKALRKDEYAINGDTPKVALTANAISGVREIYMNEGFSEYLTKPVDVRKLEGTIVRFLPKEKVVWTKE